MRPLLDLVLRRAQEADAELLRRALCRTKLKRQDVENELIKKRKNLGVDEMDNLCGHIYVARQDLGKLQARKIKGSSRERRGRCARRTWGDGEGKKRKRAE